MSTSKRIKLNKRYLARITPPCVMRLRPHAPNDLIQPPSTSLGRGSGLEGVGGRGLERQACIWWAPGAGSGRVGRGEGRGRLQQSPPKSVRIEQFLKPARTHIQWVRKQRAAYGDGARESGVARAHQAPSGERRPGRGGSLRAGLEHVGVGGARLTPAQ